MTQYMLDTNMCIYIIKKKPAKVIKKVQSIHVGDLCLSSITLAELHYGVEKSEQKQRNRQALEIFTLPLDILPFDEEAAEHYGHIRHYLARKGLVIGPLDMMIAAHALSVNAILLTNNEKEFSRLPDLKLDNWVK